MLLLSSKLKIQSPGKVLVLLSHQFHQSQDSSPQPPVLLLTLTRRVLMERPLLSMLKSPKNSVMKPPRRLKLDFHTLLPLFNLRTQSPGKVLVLLSHQFHQSQDLLPLPLLLLETLTRRVLMAKRQSLMPKSLSNSATMPPRRPKPDSHTPLLSSK
jgi:hypothetical protein